jgi:hypothetical protein
VIYLDRRHRKQTDRARWNRYKLATRLRVQVMQVWRSRATDEGSAGDRATGRSFGALLSAWTAGTCGRAHAWTMRMPVAAECSLDVSVRHR